MRVSIGFSEITTYIEKNYKFKLQITTLNDYSLMVKCTPHARIGEISLNASISLLNREVVSLGLSSLTDGVEDIIQGFIKLLNRKKDIDSFISFNSNMTIKLHLSKIPKILSYVSVNNIAVSQSSLYADLSIK